MPNNNTGTSSESSKHSEKDDASKVQILDRQIELSNGTLCQIVSSDHSASSKPVLPPLVFLHGTFHGAWCWKEHFLPFFVALGYPVIALSWRGTSKTSNHTALVKGKRNKIKISEHVSDLEAIIKMIPEILGLENEDNDHDAGNLPRPILVSHSFGGIIAMKYFETIYVRDQIQPREIFSGIVSICSVPPSGFNAMIHRSIWKSLGHTWKVIKGIPMKKATTDPMLCRYLFFDGGKQSSEDQNEEDFDVSNEDLARYQEHFRQDSQSVIDVGDLARNIPSRMVNSKGHAPFVSGLPPMTLVIGARDDRIVDFEGNVETARYFGLQKDDILLVESPHDVMLDSKWKDSANIIDRRIKESCCE